MPFDCCKKCCSTDEDPVDRPSIHGTPKFIEYLAIQVTNIDIDEPEHEEDHIVIKPIHNVT